MGMVKDIVNFLECKWVRGGQPKAGTSYLDVIIVASYSLEHQSRGT